MRYTLNKWRDQGKNMKIYELQMKLLKSLGGRNDIKNRKVVKGKSFSLWKLDTVGEIINEKNEVKRVKENKLLQKKHATNLIQ